MQAHTLNNTNLYQYTFTSENIPGIRRMALKISRLSRQIFVKLPLPQNFRLSQKSQNFC